jgi:hypothetical protein
LCQEALAFADNLIALCCGMNFDGFLINVECSLTPDEVSILLEWLSLLRHRLKAHSAHSLIIWYDAVTIDGELAWQNALNASNMPFFDACDAIFLNYAWDQSAAASSAVAAGDRACDVFLGVDVFGRGTFGGGKFNSHAASAVAQVRRCAAFVLRSFRFSYDVVCCAECGMQSGSFCARLDARVHPCGHARPRVIARAVAFARHYRRRFPQLRFQAVAGVRVAAGSRRQMVVWCDARAWSRDGVGAVLACTSTLLQFTVAAVGKLTTAVLGVKHYIALA